MWKCCLPVVWLNSCPSAYGASCGVVPLQEKYRTFQSDSDQQTFKSCQQHVSSFYGCCASSLFRVNYQESPGLHSVPCQSRSGASAGRSSQILANRPSSPASNTPAMSMTAVYLASLRLIIRNHQINTINTSGTRQNCRIHVPSWMSQGLEEIGEALPPLLVRQFSQLSNPIASPAYTYHHSLIQMFIGKYCH